MNFFSCIFILLVLSCQTKTPDKYPEKNSAKLKVNVVDSGENNIIINNKYIRVENILYPLDKVDLYKDNIMKYSETYNIDWLLIVSQILKESNFDKDAESHVGAKGLMQIMPNTEGDLKKDLEIEYIFERPVENIKAGIYHLSNQIKYFDNIPNEDDRLKIALASYNCGPGRLIDAMKITRYQEKDPYNWDDVKEALKRLKRTDYDLHLNVWANGKPKHGYFYNSKEPITYVETIWILYENLKKLSI